MDFRRFAAAPFPSAAGAADHLLDQLLPHANQHEIHRSLATTERYLRLTITDLKEAHAKFHPRERA